MANTGDRYIVKVSHRGESETLTHSPSSGIHAIDLTAAWASGVAVGCGGFVQPLGTSRDGRSVLGQYAVLDADKNQIAAVWAESV